MGLREYFPVLIGLRYLSPGRLGVAFWNEETEEEEVKIADVWEFIHKREGINARSSMFAPLLDSSVFSQVYFYKGGAYWPCWSDFSSIDLYNIGVFTKEKFECLV